VGARLRSHSKTNGKKSAEVIVPNSKGKGRTEQVVAFESYKNRGSHKPECVNEESIGVTVRVTQNRRCGNP